MQVCCPCCSTEFPIEAGLAEGDGKRLAAVLAELEPTLGRALIGYLRLFKPPKTSLRMARAAKLAREVADLSAAGEVSRDERTGVRRPASPALWAQGIDQMLQQRDRLTLPLDSHGYLRAVVFGLADQLDAAAERAREEQSRLGRRAGARPAPDTRIETAINYAQMMQDVGGWSAKQAKDYVDKARSAPS